MATTTEALLLLTMLRGMEVTTDVYDIQPCIPSIASSEGSLSPFVFIGRNLTLTCTLRSSNHSSLLYFTWKNDINMSSEYQKVISPYDLQLNMPVTDWNLPEVTLHCVDSVTGGISLGQVVKIDYAPINVTDIKILVNDWKTLSLTWESQPYNYPEFVKTSVIWTATGADYWYYCDYLNNSYCYLANSYRDSLTYKFNITVTSIKGRESNTQFVGFNSSDHVKPSPVSSVQAHNLTSTSLVLTWKQQDGKRLLFRVIQIQSSEVYNKTLSSLYTTVRDLRPFTKYDFMIDTKSVDGGYWSDAVTVTVTTLEDKPGRGPDVTPGGYQTLDCKDNKRAVIIFLKPPDQDHRNGNLTHYNVTYVVFDGGPIFTSTPDPHSLTYTTDLYCHMDYHVFISVYTRIGASPTARLHIPKQGTVLEPKIVQVGRMNTRLASVQWKPDTQAAPLFWTVFWCRGPRTSFTSQSCADEISWKKVDGSLTNISLEMDSISSFIFGVSMTKVKGSSGISWNDCIYETARAPSRKPRINSVDSRPDLGLTVRWLLPSCADLTLITHYIIEYCSNNSTHCASDKISSDHSEYVIPNLQEGVSYSVRLEEVAVSGEEGQFSDPVYGIPTHTGLKTGRIVGILVGCSIFLLIVLSAVVQCFRIARRKWNESEPIEMPRYIQNNTPNGVDSGRGSLSSVAIDSLTIPDQSPVPLSPNGQFLPMSEAVEKDGSLTGSESKQTARLSEDYTRVGLDNDSSGVSDVNPPGKLTDAKETLAEDWDIGESISDNGFDFQSDYVEAYITAENRYEDEDLQSSESDSISPEMFEDRDCSFTCI